MNEENKPKTEPETNYWKTETWINLSNSGKMGIFKIGGQLYGVSTKLVKDFADGTRKGIPIKIIPDNPDYKPKTE